MRSNVLLIPGIGNSGPAHWQSLWELKYPNTKRIQQADWEHPDCDEWGKQIEVAVRSEQVPPILVAHSLGCLVLARWAWASKLPIKAALLVAVPDPSGPNFPKEAMGFSKVAIDLGARRVILVSSLNDPYSSPEYTTLRVADWQTEHIELGPKGHINAASGLGEWQAGWKLVERLDDE